MTNKKIKKKSIQLCTCFVWFGAILVFKYFCAETVLGPVYHSKSL